MLRSGIEAWGTVLQRSLPANSHEGQTRWGRITKKGGMKARHQDLTSSPITHATFGPMALMALQTNEC